MDTKLKKTRKWAAWIIALVILLPSTILVALYPRMEQVYVQEKEKLEGENNPETESWLEVREDFVNYAVETTYYAYGQYIQEVQGKPVNFSVLEEYGWINDYYTMTSDTDFYALYGAMSGSSSEGNATYPLNYLLIKDNDVMKENVIKQMQKDGYVGYLVIEYDTYGNISYIKFNDIALNRQDSVVFFENAYKEASRSIQQYENNVAVYNSLLLQEQGAILDTDVGYEEHVYHVEVDESAQEVELGETLEPIEDVEAEEIQLSEVQEDEIDSTEPINGEVDGIDSSEEVVYLPAEEIIVTGVNAQKSMVDPMELRPKNMQAVFAIHEGSEFVFSYIMDSVASPNSIYFNMGAEWIVLAAGVFVIIMALILPFFKKLNTGKEKVFGLPVEIILCIACLTFCGFVEMFELMVYSSYTRLNEQLTLYGGLKLIGYTITADTLYKTMLVVNFIGWSFVFFMEYIVVAAFRQFICAPIHYMKEKCLIIVFFRWIKKKCVGLFNYITDISIGSGMKKSIVKIVVANFVILFILCCMWFFGVIGLVVYSIALYILLKKYGSKIQKQYESMVYTTAEMANGNLKVKMDEELGVFSELGCELKRVQDGFSKAVAQEAKSQNMKTELITNVSHDLKTPLTAIITYVDLLKKKDITEEERKEYVDTLDKKSQRLKVLIEDLFEVSKASSHNITMNYADVDLVNLLKQICLENEDKIGESTLDIRWSLPEKKCMAHLDPNRTYRIMDNLLQNALKYSMPHSRVYIGMEEEEEEYVISFKNMSATEMNFDASEITERFVRGDLSRNTEGSGLGLAIAQSFTELQNGKFSVEIDGDLFKVTLRFEKQE